MNRSVRTALAAIIVPISLLATACGGGNTASAKRPAGVPDSPTINKIIAQGELRVGVFPEYPWLVADKSSPDGYVGSAWALAKAQSAAIGVKLTPVAVSNETKVPSAQSGQVDITIAPLSVTPEREKVIDFVVYSKSTLCYYGFSNNPKVAGLTSPDQLDNPDIRIGYYVGQPPEVYLPKQYPKATLVSATGSGEAPVELLQSKRADLVIADSAKEAVLKKSNPGLVSVPGDCTTSNVLPTEVGEGVSKKDATFTTFLRDVAAKNQQQVHAVELQLLKQGSS